MSELPPGDAQTVPVQRRDGLLWDGRYLLVRQLGRGGFGEVWLAKDTQRNQQRVALKVIFPHIVEQVPDFATRFTSEILVLRALRHDGIPQIYNDGRTPAGEFFYTMQLVEGETLAQAIKVARPERAAASAILADVADVLHDSHALGVVHRDLKPGNVMLQRQDDRLRVFVLDFGIAKVVQRNAATADVPTILSQVVIGSPDYMAPEQVRGEEPTPATDVFALGVMLYEVRTGERPFRGGSSFEVAGARLHGDFAVPKEVRLDAGCRQLVESMLRLDPAQRPTMVEVRDRLRDVAAPAGVRAASPQQPAVGRRGRRRAPALALGMILAGGGLGGWFWSRGSEGEKVAPRAGDASESAPPAATIAVTVDVPAANALVGRSVLVRGHVASTAARRIEVGGQALDVDADGAFAGEVDVFARASEQVRRSGAIELAFVVEVGGQARTVHTLPLACDFDGPVLEVVGPRPDTFCGARDVPVAVRVRDASGVGRVTANDVELTLGEAGTYQGTVVLSEGAGKVRFAATDTVANPSEQVEVGVVVDTLDPELTLDPQPRAVVEGPGKVAGMCGDANLAALTVDGKPVKPDADGRFECLVERRAAPRRVMVVASDEAGHRREEAVEVPFRDRTKLRLEGPDPDLEQPPNTASIALVGAADHALATVRANEQTATATGTRFRIEVPVKAGNNRFVLTGEDEDGAAVEPLTVEVRVASPPRVPPGCTAIGVATNAGLALRVRHERSGEELALVPHPVPPFYLGVTEVTVGRYRSHQREMAPGGTFKDADKADDQPVTQVTFAEAMAYCRARGLRLPGPGEWAAAAGGPPPRRRYPWPDSNSGDAERCVNAEMKVRPLGPRAVQSASQDRSPEGVHDLAGNVREFVQDAQGIAFTCGGSWTAGVAAARADAAPARVNDPDHNHNRFTGFRVALDAPR